MRAVRPFHTQLRRSALLGFVLLAAGVFTESSVSVTGAESLVISGVPSATVFDCSRMPLLLSGYFQNVECAGAASHVSLCDTHSGTFVLSCRSF